MDITPEKKKKLTKWLIGIAAACILIFLVIQNIGKVANALSWCLGIAMPLIVGLGIALLVNVPMSFFEKNLWKTSKKPFCCKARRPVALLLSFLLVIGVLIGVISLILPTLVDTITVLIESAIDLVKKLNSMSEEEIAKLPLGQILLNVDWEQLLESARMWFSEQAHVITDTIFGTITSFVNSIMDFFVSIIFSVYIIFRKEKLKNQAQRIIHVWLPKKFSAWICHTATILSTNFKNFIVIQFFEAILLGVLCFIGMTIFQFPYATMISVLVGVTAFVPIVGGFIGGGFGTFMILTVDPIKALWFLLFFIILQQVEANLIYPKMVSSRVNLPSLWVLAAVTIGGGIGGPIGMILGVPMVATVYELVRESTIKRESKNQEIAETETPQETGETPPPCDIPSESPTLEQ